MKKILLSILVFISIAASSQTHHWYDYFKDKQYIKLFWTDSLYVKGATLQSLDTTNYKLGVVNSSGKVFKMYWPVFGSSTPGIDAVLASGSNLTANRSINGAGVHKLQLGNFAPSSTGGFNVDFTNNGTDAAGDLFYRTDSGWTRLPTGTAKQALHPNGSGGYVWKDTTAIPTVTVPIQILDVQYTNQQNSGSSETTLYTFTLPSNQMASDGDKLEIKYSGVFTSPTSAILRFKFGGNSRTIPTVSANEEFSMTADFIRTGTTTARVRYTVMGAFDKVIDVQTYDITGLDFTTTNTILLTGQDASTGQVVAKTSTITYYHYAP